MPQVINTNIASLTAQRNLESSSSALGTSLQRLSSGLRINSAKDDAAGLAIATRFTSRIQGLSVASRNANDAISLSQVAEGALQETTRILQRSRELAIQSANGTNSSADRKALQSEVNQLKNELTRISTTTTFNGLNILNGDLTNAEFQIGAEANQTVNVSISDTRVGALGSNTISTSNNNGLEQATHATFIGGGTSTSDVGVGSQIGVGASANNAYSAASFTVTNTTSTGVTNTQTATSASGDTATATATALTALTGVSASAFNQVSLSSLTVADTDYSVSVIASGTTLAVTGDDTTSFSSIASAINANTDFQAAGVYATSTSSTAEIYSTDGADIRFTAASVGANSFVTQSAVNTDASAVTIITGGDMDHTFGGRVDISLDQGYSLSSNTAVLLGGSAGVNITGVEVGLATASGGNVVETQNITLSGSTGSTTIAITQNNEASSIVTAINAVSGTTNVSAKATTELTIQNLTSLSNGVSADGTVSFDLFGQNVVGANISAAITTGDFTALVKAINDASGNTGISAAADGSNNVIKLTNTEGRDIQIQNFQHSAAVDYQAPATTAVSGDGSSVASPQAFYVEVVGNSDNNSGSAVRLYDGGNFNGQDSVVVGGNVTFTSSASFAVSSSVDGQGYIGGLFNGAASAGNASTLSSVSGVDISTATGAQSAITVLDEAINQVSEIRADLGAIQSRFESAIRNLTNNIENLNVARSRILDTDFAAETAELTKNQILTQAGVSVLGQANNLPQNILALLQ